ncbi:MAG TPA: L-aspartate oxidase [Anaeromyxobacteraceae bacterium]|nr:L-aspartate oxidase [Anaeromyxobacteraceae bacterium]
MAFPPREHVDFLVLGSGIAGLSFALEAARLGSVLMLCKRARQEGNTQYAQGGIASVLGPDDALENHVEDTVVAGAGLCHRDAVEVTVAEGPARIRWLLSLGVEFDREGPDRLHLTREGGHSRRRVAHAKDTTGSAVERKLLAAADAAGIRIESDQVAIDLITAEKAGLPGPNRALGAYVLDRTSGEIRTVTAAVTVLATGGSGKVYLYTSNPDVATGDGVAMAYRAGAAVANMEFFQFHPTCLFHPQAKSFLISEALRGEGGILRNRAGEAFMGRYDARLELAPRDIVARSIDAEVKRRGDDCAFLDMTHLPKGFLLDHFPHIYQTCKEFGVDMAVQPIPVVPAAHYQCGGVLTDLDGLTGIPNLLAVGEVACTGLHGANRLASNSLLEGLVFGRRAAVAAEKLLGSARGPLRVPDWNPGDALDPDEGVVVTHNWDEVRRLMWNYVGIVRSVKRLERARTRLQMLRSEIREYYWRYKVTPDLVELRNLADVALLIVECARRRKESRGLHYLLDYPKPDERYLRDTVLHRGELDEPARDA